MNTHDDSFMTLCNLWCEQQLTAEQLQELQTLLRSDRGLQRIFVEFTQLHGLLAWDAGVIAGSGLTGIGNDAALPPSIDCQIAPDVKQRRSRYSPRLVATVAACLLIAGIAAMNWHRASVWQLADGIAQPGDGEEADSHDLPPRSTQLPTPGTTMPGTRMRIRSSHSR
ncbi:MAG: hypothetical protein WKF77_17595 [Planctomycetaceae bacterium]